MAQTNLSPEETASTATGIITVLLFSCLGAAALGTVWQGAIDGRVGLLGPVVGAGVGGLLGLVLASPFWRARTVKRREELAFTLGALFGLPWTVLLIAGGVVWLLRSVVF
jgi:sugar phosphate permease